VSLSLDHFRIPLGIPRDQQAIGVKIEGKLGLHHVCSERRSPMRQALVQLVADMNGKDASARRAPRPGCGDLLSCGGRQAAP
jgi:hypothetical protein